MKQQIIASGRHGELLIRPVDKLPKGKKTVGKSFIVGHSETGHHHVLESNVDFTIIEPEKENLQGSIFFELVSNGKLVHKKTVNRHNDLVFAPGKYEVTHKLEYNPFTKIRERVFD